MPLIRREFEPKSEGGAYSTVLRGMLHVFFASGWQGELALIPLLNVIPVT